MAEEAKKLEIDKVALTSFTSELLGNERTAFYVPQFEFVVQVANTARYLFLSRNDSDFQCNIHCEDKELQGDAIWAGSLLSNVEQFSRLGFDCIADLSNTYVATFLQWALPCVSISVFESVPNMLSELSNINNYCECGPIFTVLASSIVAAQFIGDSLDKYVDTVRSNPARWFENILWTVHHTLTQLQHANVGLWSRRVEELLTNAVDTTQQWKDHELFPRVPFQCGDGHNVDWHMNLALPEEHEPFIEFREL